MADIWSDVIRLYRLRHSITQEEMGALLGVSQRTISRWESGHDRPNGERQRALRGLTASPDSQLLRRIVCSVENCPAPRALSVFPSLRLLAVSPPAIAKRPTIKNWIGRDMRRLATGVLEDIMSDRALLKGIAAREIACVTATTTSVLRTKEHKQIGRYHTTISYFEHEGVIYSDAISQPAPEDAPLGYRAIPVQNC